MKITDDVLVAGIIGGASLLFAINMWQKSRTPKPEKFINTIDAVGPLWHNLKISGFMSTFSLKQVAPLKEGALAYTHGMYEMSKIPWQLMSRYLEEHHIEKATTSEAEIIIVVTNKPSDATEGDGIKRYQELGLHPNFDWRKMKTGFYATINGLPTYKFRALPSSGIFTKRVVEYGDRTEYTLISPSGTETFWNTSPTTNMWVQGSSKEYTQGIELHVRKPCLNNNCLHTPPPPTFPVDITNYLPIGIQIIRGKEHHIPIGPCVAPSCHFGKTSDSDCKGAQCPSDPGFRCRDNLNRKISYATGLPLDSILAQPHPFGMVFPSRHYQSNYGNFLPSPVTKLTFS